MTFEMTASTVSLIFVVMLLISGVSGLIATHKLKEADPVDVF